MSSSERRKDSYSTDESPRQHPGPPQDAADADNEDPSPEDAIHTSPQVNAEQTQNSALSEESASVEERSSRSGSQDEINEEEETPIKLYKSSRLKSYITLALASFINYDAAQKSSNVIGSAVVPATRDKQRYALAVSIVSFSLSSAAVLIHLDRLTPLRKIWISAFRPKSRFELALAGFLVLWWSIATGIQTSVTGIAGDGKGQFSLYYSSWVCLWTSFSLLDAWMIADDSEGIKAFITSWPNRAPAWICIMVLSLSTFIWYIDLWKNHYKLDRPVEVFIVRTFDDVTEGFWQWLVTIAILTFLGSTAFVLAEIFRGTEEDGRITAKGSWENTIEGLCYLTLVLAWIPTVMVSTTPGGPASLIGNSYYFTWALMIFIFEGMVWFIHDARHDLHRELKQKEDEYKNRQKEVIKNTAKIQQEEEEVDALQEVEHDRCNRTRTEYYDSIAEL